MGKKIILLVLVATLFVLVFTSCNANSEEISGVTDTLDASAVLEEKALQEKNYNDFMEQISKPEKILDINGEHLAGEDFYNEIVDFIVEKFPENIDYVEKVYDESETKYKIIYTEDFEIIITNLADSFIFNQLIIDLDGNIFLRNPDAYLCIGRLNV